MVKEAKKAPAKKSAKKKGPPPVEKPEFGIEYLAKAMKLEPATIRQRLRVAKVKKEGRTYDFKSKAGAEKVAKQLEAVGE